MQMRLIRLLINAINVLKFILYFRIYTILNLYNNELLYCL